MVMFVGEIGGVVEEDTGVKRTGATEGEFEKRVILRRREKFGGDGERGFVLPAESMDERVELGRDAR